MSEQSGFGLGVNAGARVVRGPGGFDTPFGRATVGAHVKCLAPDGTVRWEDDLIFFDPTMTFSVNASPGLSDKGGG